MAVQKQRVAEDRPRPEDADLARPLQRCLAVAAQHLLHLGDALGDMNGEGQAAFVRRVAAVAQQIGGAGVDLHRRNDAGKPPAGMPGSPVDQRQRRREPFAAARLVPGEFELEIIVESPARRGIAGRQKPAQSALGEQVDPTVPGGRNVDQRSDAAEQQLAIGKFRAGGARRVIGCRKRLGAFV